MENLAIKIVDNELYKNLLSLHVLSSAFKNLVETEKQKLIEALAPELFNLAHIKESNTFIFQVINYANAK